MAYKTRQFYESLLSNSNVQKALNLISKAEGAAYGTLVYFGTNNDQINKRGWGFSVHPSERGFKMPNPDGTSSSASGRYQIVGATWRELQGARVVGKSFSPHEQDIAAVALLDRRGALNDVLAGNVPTFIQKTKNEWASFKVRSMNQLLSYWNGSSGALGGADGSPPGGSDASINVGGGAVGNIPALGEYSLTNEQIKMAQSGLPGNWKTSIVWILALIVGFTVFITRK